MVESLPNTRFAEVTINSNFTGTSAAMDSGKVQRINYDGHYYSFNVRYPSLTYNQAKAISGFLTKHGGPLNSFYLTVPELNDSSGNSTDIFKDLTSTYGSLEFNTLLPTITAVNTGTNTVTFQVALDSDSYSGSNLTDFYAVGDYVNFTNHNKAYQIIDLPAPLVYTGTSVVGTNYTNYYYEGQLQVGPNLALTDLAQWASGVYLRTQDVLFRVFLTDSNVSYTASTSNDTAMTLNVREEI